MRYALTIFSLMLCSALGQSSFTPVSGGGGSGTVTSVQGSGTTSGLSLSGTVTTSGSLTLSGSVTAGSVGLGNVSNALSSGTLTIGNANAAVWGGAGQWITGTNPTNLITTGTSTAGGLTLITSGSIVTLTGTATNPAYTSGSSQWITTSTNINYQGNVQIGGTTTLNGPLNFSPDGTFSIGALAANRPANISITNQVDIGGNNVLTNGVLAFGAASVLSRNGGTGELTVSTNASNIRLAPATGNGVIIDNNTNLSWTNAGYGVLGSTGTNNANGGNVWEYVHSEVTAGSAVSLATGSATNITSIFLPTAGHWYVTGNANASYGTGSTVTQLAACISLTNGAFTYDGKEGYSDALISLTSGTDTVTLSEKRIVVTTGTTVYLQIIPTFSAGAATGFGSIQATRGQY